MANFKDQNLPLILYSEDDPASDITAEIWLADTAQALPITMAKPLHYNLRTSE